MVGITINLDNKGDPYVSGIFTIEFLQLLFEECDTIDRIVHYPVGNCKLKCLESKILDVNINNDEILDDVVYVYVFFSKMNNNVPIVFGISTGNDDNVTYYTGFHEKKRTYKLSLLEQVTKENLFDVLIRESDRVNNTLTYLLDKKETYNNIKVTERENQLKNGSWIFTHTPIKQEKSVRSILLLNYKKCETKPDISLAVIPKVIVYWFKADDNLEKNIPLLFECTANGINYCYSRDSKDENKWTNILLNGHDDLKTKRRLDPEINYMVKRLPEKVEDQVPYGFNALFLGLIFYILFTIGFCLPPLYKIYRHIIKRYIGKH